MQITSDDDVPRFIEGTKVVLTKAARARHDSSDHHEWTVDTHAGGSVHVYDWQNGTRTERNFSAVELEKKK